MEESDFQRNSWLRKQERLDQEGVWLKAKARFATNWVDDSRETIGVSTSLLDVHME